MSKIYIENSTFMEYIDELATRITEVNYGAETWIEDEGVMRFTDEAQDFYNDTYDERYSNGYQSRSFNAIRISKISRIKGLSYLIGLNQVYFKNIGFTMINDGLNSRKFSFEFGFNYNFLKG